MPDLALTSITLKEALTLLILIAAVYSFIWSRATESR
jgi:hypothetical protein